MSELPKRADRIARAYVHSHKVSSSWHHSMENSVMYDIANEGRFVFGSRIAVQCGTDGLVDARNMAVRIFLEEDRGDWFWWTDTDMGWAEDAPYRLFEAANAKERPVVGAICQTQRELKPDGMGGWVTRMAPTLYDWTKLPDGQMGFVVRYEVPSNTLTRCAGTGSAFVLIHRSVFEKVAEAINPATREPFGQVWYERIRNTSSGQLLSEDLSFCLRAGALNIPIHVHTGVEASHHKEVWLNMDSYLRERAVELAIADRSKSQVAAAP